MRPRESHRRAARRIWLECCRDGEPQEEVLRLAVDELAAHPERGGGAVLAALGERLRRYHRLHHARVDSAVALDEAGQAAVRDLLAAGHGRVAAVEFGVDPGLLAGIRAQIGYTVYDASVRGRLERLEQALLDD
jgi:F-type H+-transporting ATPase subunit delta